VSSVRKPRTPAARKTRIADEQSRVEAILGSVQDGLVILDGDGNIESLNAVAARQLGVTVADAARQPLSGLGVPAISTAVHDVLHGAAAPGPVEARVHHDGDTSILACTMQRFAAGPDHRAGIALSLRDVTVQREFDKMCGEFVLRASHELRTPIASVRMGLGLLGEKLDFPQGSRDRELYDTVQHELTRMVELLSDLLDLSRLRMGEHMDFADTDIADFLGDVQQRFAAAAEKAGITWATDIQPGLPRLSISRDALDRVFNNLMNNALSHTPAGGRVAFGARRERASVVVTITDTGEGISQARQTVAFEPFAQAAAKSVGAGLGLSICREIVRRHGGEIEIYSRPRQGTRFTITLPLSKVQTTASR